MIYYHYDELGGILSALQEQGRKLEGLKQEIDKTILQNNQIIQQVSNLIKKRETEPSLHDAQKEKSGESRSTIHNLWNNKGSGLLIVKKPTWTNSFCFVVHHVEGSRAYGSTFSCQSDRSVALYKKNASYNSEAELFVTLQPEESWIEKAILQIEAKKIKGKQSNGNHSFSKKETAPENAAGPAIHLGNTVSLLDMTHNEKTELKLIPQRAEIRYKTMGYKTKNYAETLPIVEADGIHTISDESPLGKELLGKHTGETVSIVIDMERTDYKILGIIETSVIFPTAPLGREAGKNTESEE